MLLRSVSSLLLAVPCCLAQSSITTTAATQTLEPCGQVSSLLSSYAEASPSATASLRFSPQLAQECYNSVPLDQDDATDLIDGLSAMLEFQSDLEYLIDPPPGYLLAGVDLLGELSDLRDQVTSGNVTGEIDFENSIEMILGKAHDGHLTYVLDGLSVFEAARSTGSLVSISLDGVETPKVYLYGDVLYYANGTGPFPIAISQVNGVDVSEFILHLAENTTFGSLQDPDALYNSFFWSWNSGAPNIRNGPGAFLFAIPPPFDLYTNVTFENGTIVPTHNFAVTTSNFSSVVDGDSFYQAFCNVSNPATDDSAATTSATAIPTKTSMLTGTATASAPATSVTSLIGYPEPTIISSDGALSGYFLEDDGFEDTAASENHCSGSSEPVNSSGSKRSCHLCCTS